MAGFRRVLAVQLADVRVRPAANQFFLLYLVMPALGAWSAGAVLWQADVAAFGGLFSRRTPGRGIAVCLWVVVALNAVTWTGKKKA